MKIGEAVSIFCNIESGEYTTEEKGLAIKKVMEMPTHNGINKDQIFKVLEWLFYQHFEVEIRAGAKNE